MQHNVNGVHQWQCNQPRSRIGFDDRNPARHDGYAALREVDQKINKHQPEHHTPRVAEVDLPRGTDNRQVEDEKCGNGHQNHSQQFEFGDRSAVMKRKPHQRGQSHQGNSTAESVEAINQIERVDNTKHGEDRQGYGQNTQPERLVLIGAAAIKNIADKAYQLIVQENQCQCNSELHDKLGCRR